MEVGEKLGVLIISNIETRKGVKGVENVYLREITKPVTRFSVWCLSNLLYIDSKFQKSAQNIQISVIDPRLQLEMGV